MFCTKCGRPIPPDQSVCPYCFPAHQNLSQSPFNSELKEDVASCTSNPEDLMQNSTESNAYHFSKVSKAQFKY